MKKILPLLMSVVVTEEYNVHVNSEKRSDTTNAITILLTQLVMTVDREGKYWCVCV
jgi:hypothetical protein